MAIERVGERALVRRVRALALRTRGEITAAGLRPDDFQGMARRYGITLRWGRLTDNNPGCYLKDARTIVLDPRVTSAERLHFVFRKDARTIVLDPRVTSAERLHFVFHHELMHDRLEQDDDFLSLLADAYVWSDDAVMEHLCNVGAAEWLMPSADVQDMVRAYGFSTAIIPALCQRYYASSLAVAIQMAATASHQCYLVIAAPRYVRQDDALPMLVDVRAPRARPRLVMLYTVASPSAPYAIRRGQPVPADHLMCAAWQRRNEPVSGLANIPFASGTRWVVPCDALYFRGQRVRIFPRVGSYEY